MGNRTRQEQAAIASLAWVETYRRLPAEEQRRIMSKVVAGSIRYEARKAGKPDPVLLAVSYRRAADGSIEVIPGSERPLPAEYGGDGRGLSDTVDEVEPSDPNHPDLREAAARIKAQLMEPDKPTWGGRRAGAGKRKLR